MVDLLSYVQTVYLVNNASAIDFLFENFIVKLLYRGIRIIPQNDVYDNLKRYLLQLLSMFI